MINLYENVLLLAGSVAFVWAIGLVVVAFVASSSGNAAHEQNKRLALNGLLGAVRGDLLDEDGQDEPRSNRGLAIETRTGKLLPQGRLSEEAIDEVLGAKV